MKEAAGSVKNTSGNFNTLVQTKMASTLASLAETSKESHTLIRKLEASIDRGDYNVQSMVQPMTAELNDLIQRSQVLTLEMENTLRTLRESPSDLLFKKSTPNPGPGE